MPYMSGYEAPPPLLADRPPPRKWSESGKESAYGPMLCPPPPRPPWARALYEAHAQCRLDVLAKQWKRPALAPNVGVVPRAQLAEEPQQALAHEVHAEIATLEAQLSQLCGPLTPKLSLGELQKVASSLLPCTRQKQLIEALFTFWRVEGSRYGLANGGTWMVPLATSLRVSDRYSGPHWACPRMGSLRGRRRLKWGRRGHASAMGFVVIGRPRGVLGAAPSFAVVAPALAAACTTGAGSQPPDHWRLPRAATSNPVHRFQHGYDV